MNQSVKLDQNDDLLCTLNESLKEHNVPGLSIGIIDPACMSDNRIGDEKIPSCVYTVSAGHSKKADTGDEKNVCMNEDTWMQHASLSKTIAAAFSIEYFSKLDIPLTTPVNELFDKLGSEGNCSGYRLKSGTDLPTEWAEKVTLAMLINHTALGMHYVYGIPPSREGGMPAVLDLLTGVYHDDYGYADMPVDREPGTQFKYSGGGFLVLQHLLELREKKPIEVILRPFLDACGMPASTFSFDQVALGGNAHKCASGYLEDGSMVQDSRLMFPPLAAGGHGTAVAMATFLFHLGTAYKLPAGEKSGAISHATAVLMIDTGRPGDNPSAIQQQCFEFMRSNMGLGVFVLSAGPNTFLLHQAANDGFRGLYLVCVDGPDALQGPRGAVILSNGNNNAMFLNCAVAKAVLKTMKFQGMDWSLVDGKDFSSKGIAQEQIVNLGLRELVLAAFQ
ncbi:beta-lactamase [Sphaeroforma arctica JP610]|uniref:Beta-lactamase n=1 Tax=Sphaeroforma arctica JP610 TaxID=667725 RepID=A0A0L0FQX5_9EUKA|nr:beta-lactamase [Sphaeroforma arctica JP610]KNC78413.1 beta-lactamase [Sphaeroforma arctica JP610]|eukprot:XP_014152315.1 beta-lactamase [Sphaeroforma arctica JP610]